MTSQRTKERLKQVMDDVEDMDLPDGAHWALINQMMNFDYGDAESIIAEDPDFFGFT